MMNSGTEIRIKSPKARFVPASPGNERTGSDDIVLNTPIPDAQDLEGNEIIRNYFEWLGFSAGRGLVVLSSIHHYYYDAEEMKNTRTLVNLKELNQISDINAFLSSLSQILPPGCHLVGCFTDNKKQSGFSFRKKYDRQHPDKKDNEKNGIESRIPFLNTIFTFLDARTNNYMSASHVDRLLRNNGFIPEDMTELEGLTCFCAQKDPSKH
jgi:hypothetical protein